MGSVIEDDGNGRYLVGKRNVYLSLAVVIGIVVLSGITVHRATTFENALNHNSSRVQELVTQVNVLNTKVTALEVKMINLEWKLDRIEQIQNLRLKHQTNERERVDD